MPVTPIKATLCRSCKHWYPLFTGDAWGVRSFIDAPIEAKTEIKAKLAAQISGDGYADVYDALGYSQAGITDASDSGANDVPGGLDWPEWGECARTSLRGVASTTSLARAIDGSMYRAILRCHANFGCVQWEETNV